MVVFPNAKINLGLRITAKREDGYHNLETVFYPLPLCDALEAIRLPASEQEFLFSAGGQAIEAPQADNLCVKAWQLLKKDFPGLAPVHLHLHKAIPSGAGLGGGSADAAFTLKLLNDLFHLDLSRTQLLEYALQLGSDCPFFILNTPSLGTGRGEKLEPFSLDLSAFSFVLINPGIHIPTGKAFSWLKPAAPEKGLTEILSLPVSEWKNELRNDFEEPVFLRYPEIEMIKDLLYRSGALYASMSGSGSTVFGIFPADHFADLDLPSHYFIRRLPSS